MKSRYPVCLGFTAALLFGCGGGGGGGAGDDGIVPNVPETPPTILSTYNYEIGEMLENIDFFVDAGGQYDIAVDFGNSLQGSVNLDVNSASDVSFLSYTTSAGSTMRLDVIDRQTDLDGIYTITVTSAVNAEMGDYPTTGSFDIAAFNDTITVTMTSTGPEMSLNGAAAVQFTWEEYEELLDNPVAATWQRRASLVGATFGLVYDLMFAIAEQLDELELTETVNPTVEVCDMFPSAPPPDVLAQGESVFTRLSPGEEINPGDLFHWQFTNCWSSFSDVLVDGEIQLENYIEEIDANNTLTRIGFAPVGNVFGGVSFFDWTISPTEQNQGVFTIDPSEVITIRGGFSLLFAQGPVRLDSLNPGE